MVCIMLCGVGGAFIIESSNDALTSDKTNQRHTNILMFKFFLPDPRQDGIHPFVYALPNPRLLSLGLLRSDFPIFSDLPLVSLC